MEPDPQDPVAALVKVLEGWAAGQEGQAVEHAERQHQEAQHSPPKNVGGRRCPGISGGV